MRVLAPLRKSFLDLPSPLNLSTLWNFGSLLGLCLAIQLSSGLLLACHYVGSADMAFDSVVHIIRDVKYGWLLRTVHANGASLFFFCLYIHIGRGLYYSSYYLSKAWLIGFVLLLLVIGIAFLGYVLPWGQISFWGASVITSLLSSVPYLGQSLVEWVWGGPSVDSATLTRFYTLHFILPFLLAASSMGHLIALHETGSSNPLGVSSDYNKVPFHQYYSWKDLVGVLALLGPFFFIVFTVPYMLGDPENFIEANRLVTPTHIQPEWYFLFAYAILRAVPNKLGGVLAIVFSLVILCALPFIPRSRINSLSMYPLTKVLFWFHVVNFFILTWLGSQPVVPLFVVLSSICSVLYFLFYLVFPLIKSIEDYILWQ